MYKEFHHVMTFSCDTNSATSSTVQNIAIRASDIFAEMRVYQQYLFGCFLQVLIHALYNSSCTLILTLNAVVNIVS